MTTPPTTHAAVTLTARKPVSLGNVPGVLRTQRGRRIIETRLHDILGERSYFTRLYELLPGGALDLYCGRRSVTALDASIAHVDMVRLVEISRGAR